MLDPEVKAMGEVFDTLKELDDEAKSRVIEWTVNKFSLEGHKSLSQKDSERENGNDSDLLSYETVSDVFAKAITKTQQDKVLLAAAFLQVKNGLSELTGAEINKELRHLGHGVTNITDVTSQLSTKKPQLIIQTRKEGKSRQAKKKYKVTGEGLKAAKALLNSTELES